MMFTENQQIRNEPRKCYYHDKGYCKYKDKCKCYHPIMDCVNKWKKEHVDIDTENNAYMEIIATITREHCVNTYIQTNNWYDVTLTPGDDQQVKTHKVILTEPSTNYENEVKCLEKQVIEYKIEIEQNYEGS